MRFQTTFEKIATSMNGQWFGFFYIALRLAIGLSIVYYSSTLMWGSALSTDVTNICIAALGVCLVLGLLVRPLSTAGAILSAVALVLMLGIGGAGSEEFFVYLSAFFIFGLFSAGGAGHAFGLDGLLLRNIRNPNRLVKFLFG